MNAGNPTTWRGRLIVLAAPSGAGKTSLVHALLERSPDLSFSVSYTTRPRRRSEQHGRDYFFVDEGEFRDMIEQDAFLEYARVFGHWYGTGRDHVESMLDAGRTVLLEIDWQGARQVRERLPEARSIFILPPSFEELSRRLRGRGTDSEATIERRLADAAGDMTHWNEFDFVLINDDIAAAADALACIVAGGGAGYESGAPGHRARIEAIVGEAPRGTSR